ncbi:alginate lyase family protein [Anaeromicrobium sediminis]|nr:alginate lyase family protein [Anaeromicrobium sediminis]
MYNLQDIMNREKINVFSFQNLSDEQTIEFSDNIIKGYYLTRQKTLIQLGEGDIWGNAKQLSVDRSVLFWLHSLSFLPILCTAYEMTGIDKYMDKAMELMDIWNELYIQDSKEEFSWHDHSTAIRLINISKLFECWKVKNWNGKNCNKFLEMVDIHLRKLVEESFYMVNHNHGLDQDIAVFVGATVFDILEESNKYKQIALERLDKQINYLFANDGSYKEHSPHYSLLICTRLFDLLNFAYSTNQQDKVSNVKTILEKALKFIRDVTYKDGLLSNLGDSENVDVKKYIFNKRLRDCQVDIINMVEEVFNGKRKTNAIYKDGNYAILNTEESQLIFSSSFHTRVHKHHDDLSFILYGHNQPLLIDCGKYNYNYNDKERQYVISAMGHNTVMVDDMNTDIKRLNIGKSGIINYYFGKEKSFVSGIQCLYEGIIHNRSIISIKEKEFIILDEIKGYKNHKFEQLFNFHPTIECQINQNMIVGRLEDNSEIYVTDLLRDSKNIILHKGENEQFRGWCSLEYNKIEPTYQGTFVKEGTNARFATHICLDKENIFVNSFEWIDDRIKISYDNKYMTIIDGKSNKYIQIDDQLIQANKLNKLKIQEAIDENIQYVYKKKYTEERNRRELLEKKVMGIDEINMHSDKVSPQKIGEEIAWECDANGEGLQYAWYIYRNGQIYEKISYKKTNKLKWKPNISGKYIIKVFVKNDKGNKIIKKSGIYIIQE